MEQGAIQVLLTWILFSKFTEKNKKQILSTCSSNVLNSCLFSTVLDAEMLKDTFDRRAHQLMDMQPEIYWWLPGPDMST